MEKQIKPRVGFDDLNDQLISLILNRLTPNQLAQLESVSKRWQRLASDGRGQVDGIRVFDSKTHSMDGRLEAGLRCLVVDADWLKKRSSEEDVAGGDTQDQALLKILAKYSSVKVIIFDVDLSKYDVRPLLTAVKRISTPNGGSQAKEENQVNGVNGAVQTIEELRLAMTVTGGDQPEPPESIVNSNLDAIAELVTAASVQLFLTISFDPSQVDRRLVEKIGLINKKSALKLIVDFKLPRTNFIKVQMNKKRFAKLLEEVDIKDYQVNVLFDNTNEGGASQDTNGSEKKKVVEKSDSEMVKEKKPHEDDIDEDEDNLLLEEIDSEVDYDSDVIDEGLDDGEITERLGSSSSLLSLDSSSSSGCLPSDQLFGNRDSPSPSCDQLAFGVARCNGSELTIPDVVELDSDDDDLEEDDGVDELSEDEDKENDKDRVEPDVIDLSSDSEVEDDKE